MHSHILLHCSICPNDLQLFHTLYPKTMSTFTNSIALFHVSQKFTTPQNHHCNKLSLPIIRASFPSQQNNVIISNRRKLITTFLVTSLAALGPHGTPAAIAENWGTHSFLRERFLEPGLSPEDAAARIKQTAEGLHSMRDMLETCHGGMSCFTRLKQAYLSQDLKNAMSTLPQGRKEVYVKTANELVENMAEFDYYVRTPEVYESYLYYEKTLKSIDDLVALLGYNKGSGA